MDKEKPLVLVIDNVSELVEELLTLMDLSGINTVGAHDLNEGIAILEAETSIRVISCDVRLDRESGLDIVERVASHPALRTRNLQYLFVTGDQMQLEQIGSQAVHAVLSKPVQPSLLVGTLRRMLAQGDNPAVAS